VQYRIQSRELLLKDEANWETKTIGVPAEKSPSVGDASISPFPTNGKAKQGKELEMEEVKAKKVSIQQALQEAGYDSMVDLMEQDPLTYPACCSQGCEVEMDGRCEHGFPSVVLASGMV
jgi:hypothetical protein